MHVISDSVVANEQLVAMELVAASVLGITSEEFTSRTIKGRTGQHPPAPAKVWPNYPRLLDGALPNFQGTGPDRLVEKGPLLRHGGGRSIWYGLP
jgi:hypothetical protein